MAVVLHKNLRGSVPAPSTTISPSRRPFDFMPTNDLNYWNSDVTAGVTVTLDPSVSFKDGLPAICVTIPAGLPQGTVIKVGTSGSAGKGMPRVPYNWDLRRLSYAIRTTNAALLQLGASVYLGDASYANFWVSGINATHYGGSSENDTQTFIDNEWFCPKLAGAMGVGGGAPTAANLARCKMTFQLGAATNKPEKIWIGFVGCLPKRTKATVILSLDDGYAGWDTYLMDRLKYYGIPCSFAIVTGSLGQSNVMTAARVKARFDEPHKLFDFILHQDVHTNITEMGTDAYVAGMLAGRQKLRNMGITGDGPNHHAWVQSLWNNAAIAKLRSAGFLSARNAGYTAESGFDQLMFTANDRWAFILNTTSVNLTSDVSFSQVQEAIQKAQTDGSYVFVNGHDVVKAPVAPYQWSYDNFDQLLDWLASEEAAGRHEVKSHTKWFADATGRFCDRR